MRSVISNLVAAVVLTASTGAAFAQQAPERTDDVSSINGQLVPVGDHNQYHYDFKKVNVALNPLGWAVGLYGVSASVAVHQNLVLRGDLTVFDAIGGDESAVQGTLSAPIYLRRAYQGAFLEPGVIVRSYSDEDYEGNDEGHTEVGAIAYVGWTWLWDSGLNVTVAAGLGRNFNSEENEYGEETVEEITGDAYLRFGYAF